MIRLVTYSTKPRGGVVHALALAEALDAAGADVELWALAPDGAGFFRETPVRTRLVPVARDAGEDVEARILRYADALADALRDAGPARVHHAEDCLSARSLLRLRAEGVVPAVVRTVHHVDDFPSPVLMECQRASIQDVDVRVCVSAWWAGRLREEFAVEASVIPNGVDAERFAGCPLDRAEAGERMGWGPRPTVLAVGGVEPRKGARALLAAFARARDAIGPDALLVIAGGATLFDYAEYRAAWRADADALGLVVHDGPAPPGRADVAVIGPVDDPDMPALYRAADALAFPSTREGFGLVVLEALAAGIPAVVSDLPVLREHLADGRDCLMVPVDDPAALADGIVRAMTDPALRRTLATGGARTVAGHTWAAAAAAHLDLYARAHALA